MGEVMTDESLLGRDCLLPHPPPDVEGDCFICGKRLTRASYCMPCGGFVCWSHEYTVCATAPFGEEIMIPMATHLQNILGLATDEKMVHEVQLTPGPQPAPRQMRTWEGKRGRSVPRGSSFPLLKPGSVVLDAPQLTTGEEVTADDGEEVPF